MVVLTGLLINDDLAAIPAVDRKTLVLVLVTGALGVVSVADGAHSIEEIGRAHV